MQINPNFAISDKTRELAHRVTILGILVVVLRVYTIPVDMIPMVKAPTEILPHVQGEPVLGLSTIAAVATIYYFFIYVGRYLTERNMFENINIKVAYEELEATSQLRKFPQSTETQISSAFRRNQYRLNSYINHVGGYIRFITDCLVPVALTILATCTEFGNILSTVRVLL